MTIITQQLNLSNRTPSFAGERANDMNGAITRMRDIVFDEDLFVSFRTGTILDTLLCSYQGLPKGVNYMLIGDPGVGKTTIILDMLSDIQANHPGARILFISAEMNEIDLFVYVERYPKFKDLHILFVESDWDIEKHNWPIVSEVIEEGWDIIAIDSFYELQSIVKEEENIRMKDAESMILSMIKKQNKAQNRLRLNTTFITIQQVTKSGVFVGSNRLKHAITAMMELRLENAKNIYSDRYIVFSKHRRGDVGVRLYYSLNSVGNVFYDAARHEKEQKIKRMQHSVSSKIRDFAGEFDKIFNEEIMPD
jgi:Predicted ATP-dependent serine protease